MKKYFKLSLTVCLITACLSMFIGLAFAQSKSDTPSQRFTQRERILLMSIPDLRLYLSEYPTLTNRVHRGVCLVEAVHSPVIVNPEYSKEVDVASGISLEAVLKQAKFDQSMRQVRIFKQNTISQTPTEKWDDPEAIRFRKTLILRGDIVVLTLHGE